MTLGERNAKIQTHTENAGKPQRRCAPSEEELHRHRRHLLSPELPVSLPRPLSVDTFSYRYCCQRHHHLCRPPPPLRFCHYHQLPEPLYPPRCQPGHNQRQRDTIAHVPPRFFRFFPFFLLFWKREGDK